MKLFYDGHEYALKELANFRADRFFCLMLWQSTRLKLARFKAFDMTL